MDDASSSVCFKTLVTLSLMTTLDAIEREAKVKESVDKAKEAVGLDVRDGISWSE